MYYTRSLKFEEKPDYNYVRQLLEDAVPDFSPIYLPPYDWVQLRVIEMCLSLEDEGYYGNCDSHSHSHSHTSGRAKPGNSSDFGAASMEAFGSDRRYETRSTA